MTEIVSVIVPTYRDWKSAYTLAQKLGEQILPTDIHLEVIIVDDGSEEDSPAILDQLEHVRLLRLKTNIGRAGARNAGSHVAKGQYLVFIDCDCEPIERDFLATHLHALHNGSVGSTGHVFGVRNTFWDKYQRLASQRRQKQHHLGHQWVGSTQNLAVLRHAFEQAGRFDTSYRHYGFEDRELLIRLASIGNVAWPNGASVLHNDALRLSVIVEKMIQAAQNSAKTFSATHMEAYRTLGYARIDARLHPWLRILAGLIAPIIRPCALVLDKFLSYLPFWLAYPLVKAVTACAFLYGSTIPDQSPDVKQ